MTLKSSRVLDPEPMHICACSSPDEGVEAADEELETLFPYMLAGRLV